MTFTIRRLGPGDDAVVRAAGHLFDGPVQPAAADRFLASPEHHLLVAFDGDGRALGFVSAVEMTHPDKGTELFLYELGVEEAARGRGVGSALVSALRDLARGRGCYGMWVLTDADNEAALATYRRAGASGESPHVMLEWAFERPGTSEG